MYDKSQSTITCNYSNYNSITGVLLQSIILDAVRTSTNLKSVRYFLSFCSAPCKPTYDLNLRFKGNVLSIGIATPNNDCCCRNKNNCFHSFCEGATLNSRRVPTIIFRSSKNNCIKTP